MLRLLFNLLQEPSLILVTTLVSPVLYQTNDSLSLILGWIFPFLSLVNKQLFYLPKSLLITFLFFFITVFHENSVSGISLIASREFISITIINQILKPYYLPYLFLAYHVSTVFFFSLRNNYSLTNLGLLLNFEILFK